jgi:hypothetical protein
MKISEGHGQGKEGRRAGVGGHLDTAQPGEHVGQAEARMLKHSACLAGVKQIGDVYAKVSLQPHDVPVRPMQHFHNLSHNTTFQKALSQIFSLKLERLPTTIFP